MFFRKKRKSRANSFTTYRYWRTKYNNPALTFRFEIDQIGEWMKFSFSLCSEEDNFSRETGRDIADKRMEAGEFIQCPYSRSISLVENAIQALMIGYDIRTDSQMLNRVLSTALFTSMYKRVEYDYSVGNFTRLWHFLTGYRMPGFSDFTNDFLIGYLHY